MEKFKSSCPLLIKQVYRKFRAILLILFSIVKKTIKCILSLFLSKYPKTIQLPITYKCNFDCVMCGMRKQISKKGFTPEELGTILQNRLFSRITSVGVNGGEPFLLDNLEDYINILFQTLPKLKGIYIITNGYFTDAILEKSKKILKICHSHNATLSLSVSIDGYKEMQDKMRGHKEAFIHVTKTVNAIMKNYKEYCDSFGTICTITKINVDYLAELDTWANMNCIPINYNIATMHKRIHNEDRFENFSVFTDEHARLIAQEFFYTKFLETQKESYFALYYYLNTGRRIASCDHKKNVVTLTPDGKISYCATFSEKIGNAMNHDAYKIYFLNKNLRYRREMQKEHCATCSHYTGGISLKNYITLFSKEIMRTTKIYR